MEPVITPAPPVLPAGGIQFDFYCEAYSCWMLKSSCEARQRRAITGHYENRTTYASAGCGSCRQLKGEHLEEKDGKAEKKCKGPCGRTLTLDEFGKHKNMKDGKDSWCKQCRSKASKAWYEKNKKKPVAKKTGVDEKLKKKLSKLTRPPREADAQPLLQPSGFSPIGPLSTPVTVDFSGHKDIFEAISDMARNEFRPLDLQILYMLQKQVNQI